MEKKVYSSPLVQALMENNRWNFWSKDWSKVIVVEWDGVPLKSIRADIVKLVGEDFKYERTITSRPTEYIASKKGLTAIN